MKPRLLLMLGCIIFLFLDCGGRKGGEAIQKEKASLRVTFGEQGGFSGAYSGYTVEESGDVFKLSRSPGRETERVKLGTINQKEIKDLKSKIDSADFFNIAYRKTGNMTYSIEIQMGTLENRVHWSVGDNDIPDVLSKLRMDLLAMVRGL